LALWASCSFCLFLIEKKLINFKEDPPMYIPTKFDSNWTSDFGEGNLNVKILKTMVTGTKWLQ
jgi:hypothetical protein